MTARALAGWLGPATPKLPGLQRARAPEETAAVLEPMMWSRFGVTRLAPVIGLDRIGIPVVMAIRPNRRTPAVRRGSRRALARPSRRPCVHRRGRRGAPRAAPGPPGVDVPDGMAGAPTGGGRRERVRRADRDGLAFGGVSHRGDRLESGAIVLHDHVNVRAFVPSKAAASVLAMISRSPVRGPTWSRRTCGVCVSHGCCRRRIRTPAWRWARCSRAGIDGTSAAELGVDRFPLPDDEHGTVARSRATLDWA